MNTDSDVVGDAFEVFSESQFIGEKGEFFTPRGVVRIAVKLADPHPGELVCDPACGSGGFLIYSMKYMWNVMAKSPKWRGVNDLKEQQRLMAVRSFFGIDKETDLVKIAKAHMAIAGDGRSNIIHENTLHKASEFAGNAKIHFVEDDEFRTFDIILTNPPFGTKAKVLSSDASNFLLGHKWVKSTSGDWARTQKPVDRDPYVLFVERCINLLNDDGVLGIVLPETVFHAPTLGYLREFFLKDNNLVAIIDLPHNTFRPNCNAKTCLMVLKKGQSQQNKVVMATPIEMGHDHQGRALNRPGTDELWDDLKNVVSELDAPGSAKNEYVFSVKWSNINPNILVPRFYRGLRNPPEMPKDRFGVKLGDIVEKEIVNVWDGHGSPPSHAKGGVRFPISAYLIL